MDFYEVINSRRTIRDFEPFEIDNEVIERIISAGMKAPTNDHMRDWHFVVIKDKSVVNKLLCIIPEYTDDDASAAIRDWNINEACQQTAYRNAIPKQHRMLAEASCVIVPLFLQKTDIMHPDTLSHLNGFASIWCCIENMLLAAVAENLACTLRIPLSNEGAWSQEVLGYPKEYLAPCFIAVGKPRESAQRAKQLDYSLSERIHYDNW